MPVDSGVSNDLMTVFSNTVSAGFANISGAVNGLFGIMIVLTVAHEAGSRVQVTERMLMMAAVNSVLGRLFAAEAPWLRRWNLPFGLSLLVLARPVR